MRPGQRAVIADAAESAEFPDPGWRTLPNLVTVVRLAVIVPVAVLIVRHEHPIVAVVLLALFGTTDWVDGYLARRLRRSSAVGAVLDPVADRIGVVVIAVAFVVSGDLPLWVVVTILLVDVALGVVYLARRGGRPPGVTPVGKARTAVLMTGVALLGLGLLPTPFPFTAVGQVLCGIGAALHVLAGLGYLRTLVSRRRTA